MELTRFDLKNQALQERIAHALERIADALEKRHALEVERIADAVEVLASRFQPEFGEMLLETTDEKDETPAAAIADILRTVKQRANSKK